MRHMSGQRIWRRPLGRRVVLGVCTLGLAAGLLGADANVPAGNEVVPFVGQPGELGKPAKAAIITVEEMVDGGLYESIQRRTETAIAEGATYVIYRMDTFGGRVDAGLDIYTYLLQDVRHRARTVAYVPTKAISAGALISVACQDIILREGAKLGDCAPIMMGGALEGVEREKIESTLRSYFTDAAQINGYPEALCRAMVSAHLEVWAVKNTETGETGYFESEDLPEEGGAWDVEGASEVVSEGELLTVTAEQAVRYGLAREAVSGTEKQAEEAALAFLEERDGVAFGRPVEVLKPTWSEQMVRWLTSPIVSGVLLLVALLGIYAEMNTPGVGLPGAVALAALAVLFGSRFLIGLANWWEIALFFVGLGLLAVEIFVIPGFGIAGITGILAMLVALAAMMVQNAPDEVPLPKTPYEWDRFEAYVLWTCASVGAFFVLAAVLARYLPKLPIARGLILAAPTAGPAGRVSAGTTIEEQPPVRVGQKGVTLTPLRPSGAAKFDSRRISVVAQGQMIEAHREIVIVRLEGNSIVVRETNPPAAS